MEDEKPVMERKPFAASGNVNGTKKKRNTRWDDDRDTQALKARRANEKSHE